MEVKDIQNRITKKEADIAKIEKRIKKWQDQKSDKALKKEYDYYQRNGLYYNPETGNYDQSYDEFKNRVWDNWVRNCDNEIKYAESDLADANVTLDKYHNLLKAAEAREAQLNEEKIPVIWEFLQNWKKSFIEYIEENTKTLEEYYKLDKEYCDLFNNRGSFKRNHTEEEFAEYTKKMKEVEKKEKIAKANVNPVTQIVYHHRDKSIDMAKLNEIADKEVDAKYIDMVNKVTEITGKITDASGLRLGGKGDINGFIIGEKGKASLETIMAGGYNQHEIVNVRHGQILHFRTLVHKIS